MKILLMTSLLFASSCVLADETAQVAIPSLEVKERLLAIDQINVTAPTEKVAPAPSTAAVEALLEEAQELDQRAESETASH
jgi:hypothetical protein